MLYRAGLAICATVLLVGWFARTSPAGEAAPAAVNFLPNGSFEEAERARPRRWSTQRWDGQGEFEYAQVGRTGKRSVAISSERGADIAWTITVPIEPYSVYRLSGWIKTENLKPVGNARGALLNIHGAPAATNAVTGTSDWTRVEVTFEVEDEDAVQVNCLLGGWGLATGKAWYDDLQLERIAQGKAVAVPTISIDAGKTGEPISKYVYGQFIEHMGRCIYGGIWAEMLEDRKFFNPVGHRESPWRSIGGEGAVRMEREGAFVGVHTPRVVLAGDGSPRGLVQAGLGVVAGKDYVGRIWLAGEGQPGPVSVSLVWGDGAGDRQTVRIERVGAEFVKTDLKFTAGARTDNARIEITAAGNGSVRVGTLSLMPADNVQGMRADTLKLLKELDAPVYRWPGGNFVSGYNWKDGIGDPDRRPPRKNPAWTGIEHNDMGIHEFMTFCRVLETEPYIAVNSGLGDVQSAREQVEYVNGAAESPMGRLRAKNGHAEPYKVRYWGIGNEMYGSWQLGNMPIEQYVRKHNEFAEAMRKVDPSIKLVAVGEVGRWSEAMMQGSADHMELISEHFYVQQRPGLSGHVRLVPDSVRRIAQAHRNYRERFDSLKGKDIRIAMDEWNYWYGPHIFGELGTRYFLKDGLGIAAGLHEFARHSDMYYMANYAQTVNVIGCIKTSKTAAAFETTGLVLKLYRHHFGTIPVATETTGLLDAQAAWSADRKLLTIGVVNPTMEKRDVPLTLKGARLSGSGTRWQMAGNDPMAYNDPSDPPKIVLEESRVTGVTDKLAVAPCSVTLFVLQVE
jgi:alpha-L-arabinofuranosidase